MLCHVIAYVFTYVPGSLYAIRRAHRHIDGLRGWRARSHAYCIYRMHPYALNCNYYSLALSLSLSLSRVLPS
uniref:Uncharacterized protein n=1 Tax=Nelumbo nucifera TaxID=4432 RepID=A0A822Y3I9_NELNU|nr:TPA_asm: hypothetical protein HUJ06_027629 [Nelumbo nucifera]